MNWSATWADKPTSVNEPIMQSTADPRDQLSRDQVLFTWQRLQEALAKAKEAELEYRKYVVKRAFPEPKEGVNNLDLGNGYTLKANVKFNYRLLDNETVESCLAKIAKIGNQGNFVADRLVSWKPSFLLTEFRALQEEDTEEAKQILRLVHEMLIIDEAAPSVNITAPKVKK